MSKIKEKLKEASQSTKVAFLGGALVVAGTWGSCELQLAEQGSEAPEASAAEQPMPAPEPAAEEEPGPEEAAPEEETE